MTDFYAASTKKDGYKYLHKSRSLSHHDTPLSIHATSSPLYIAMRSTRCSGSVSSFGSMRSRPSCSWPKGHEIGFFTYVDATGKVLHVPKLDFTAFTFAYCILTDRYACLHSPPYARGQATRVRKKNDLIQISLNFSSWEPQVSSWKAHGKIFRVGVSSILPRPSFSRPKIHAHPVHKWRRGWKEGQTFNGNRTLTQSTCA